MSTETNRRDRLPEILDLLEAHYGAPKSPRIRDPWSMIVWENVVYLVDDERRDRAFDMLVDQVGLAPADILNASDEALLPIVSIGILPEQRIAKLRQCAEIARTRFSGDLDSIRTLPAARARRELQRFPRIGAPSAERIMLFAGWDSSLPLESNALRVLLRLGFGEPSHRYDTCYRSAQQAAQAELPTEQRSLERTHLLLRQHGEQICRRSTPQCATCPLSSTCPSSGDEDRWAIPWEGIRTR
jgi:endonuclease III